MALATGNPKTWGPTDALREAIRLIESGEMDPTKAVIVLLDDNGDGYDTLIMHANLHRHESFALLMDAAHTVREGGQK